MKLFDPTRKFYKGNLHVHTTVSDGRKSPEEVMDLYQANGYDFLALTDHWRISPTGTHKNMLVLSGMEIDYTLQNQVLHVVCILPDDTILQKLNRENRLTYQEAIDLVNDHGGAAIVAHPAWSLNTYDFLLGIRGACAAEIYNTVSGAPWNGMRADSSGILDVVSTWGKYYPLVASDDAHFYTGDQCVSFTMVQADELTPAGIIAALKRGSFYASQGPQFLDVEVDAEQLTVRTTPVSRVTFSSNLVYSARRSTMQQGITELSYPFARDRGERFVRCEIEDQWGRRAWLSPIALDALK